ncbi:MAG: ABC transporter [Nitrospiraceae bacterium]|jgi:ABC-2 type transport system permease protein|nr:ABC transporter [Nitrospiraceae bacterium]|tara:strand:+ start:1299 stop:2072 length:774 start_codon:yes stop_codon:yes gene_type:complete
MNNYIQEIWALTMRWIKRLSRERFSLLFTLAQPMLFWLILFGSLFQRATEIQDIQAPNYMSFLAAGVVVMTVLNNGLAGGVDLLFDKENGFLERMLTTPIARSSIIISRFIFVMGITSLQVLFILLVAYLFGVHPVTGFGGVIGAVLIGLLFGVGLTAISMAMAFAVKSHGDFFSALGFLSLPAIFLSTALVPFSAMPAWMAFLAHFNPMTYAVEAIRSLILVGWAIVPLVKVVLVMIVFDALCLYGSVGVFKRNMG